MGDDDGAKLEDVQKHDYVLTPGRYVGAADAEEDSEPFPEKMQRLTAQLKTQFEEGDSGKVDPEELPVSFVFVKIVNLCF